MTNVRKLVVRHSQHTIVLSTGIRPAAVFAALLLLAGCGSIVPPNKLALFEAQITAGTPPRTFSSETEHCKLITDLADPSIASLEAAKSIKEITLLFKAEKLLDAATRCDLALLKFPNNYDLNSLMALVLREAGQYTVAATYSGKALTVAPRANYNAELMELMGIKNRALSPEFANSSLEISTEPATAEIFVEGTRVGKGYVMLDGQPGLSTHIRVLSDGYVQNSFIATVPWGQSAKVRVSLAETSERAKCRAYLNKIQGCWKNSDFAGASILLIDANGTIRFKGVGGYHLVSYYGSGTVTGYDETHHLLRSTVTLDDKSHTWYIYFAFDGTNLQSCWNLDSDEERIGAFMHLSKTSESDVY